MYTVLEGQEEPDVKDVPSLNDVATTKMENILEEIDSIIETEDLTKYLQAIENKVNDSDYTAMDMAAAFLKVSSGQKESQWQWSRQTRNRAGAEKSAPFVL